LPRPTSLGIPECLADGVLVLGAPAGSPAYCENEVATRISKVATLLDSLASLEDPQVQYVLLRSCFGLPKFVYCLNLNRAITSFDEAQCRALGDIVGASIAIDDATWLLASLPVSLGGLGTRSATAHSAAAFIASVLQTETMVVRLLGPLTSRQNLTKAHSFLASATANATTPAALPYGAHTTQKELSRRMEKSRLHTITNIPHHTDQMRALFQSLYLPHTGIS
jgi:hypothetical protein